MTENADQTHSNLQCGECGGKTYEDTIRMAVWDDDRLVVIEGVPARICEGCSEQFYDEETTSAIRRLTTSGFPKHRAVREIQVPVFSLQETEQTAMNDASRTRLQGGGLRDGS